jgi:hypothetical protein
MFACGNDYLFWDAVPNPEVFGNVFHTKKGNEFRCPYEPHYGHRRFRLYRSKMVTILTEFW